MDYLFCGECNFCLVGMEVRSACLKFQSVDETLLCNHSIESY